MKEQIINIAIRQMRSGGYENLNFAGIASELEMSRANLHHHFKNKEGLGLAAVKQYIVYDKIFKNGILSSYPADTKAALTELERQLAEVLQETHVGNSCILPQILHDGEVPESLRRLVVQRFKEEQREFELHIIESQNAGTLGSQVDAAKAASRIMIAMFGVIQMALIMDVKSTIPEMINGNLCNCLT